MPNRKNTGRALSAAGKSLSSIADILMERRKRREEQRRVDEQLALQKEQLRQRKWEQRQSKGLRTREAKISEGYLALAQQKYADEVGMAEVNKMMEKAKNAYVAQQPTDVQEYYRNIAAGMGEGTAAKLYLGDRLKEMVAEDKGPDAREKFLWEKTYQLRSWGIQHRKEAEKLLKELTDWDKKDESFLSEWSKFSGELLQMTPEEQYIHLGITPVEEESGEQDETTTIMEDLGRFLSTGTIGKLLYGGQVSDGGEGALPQSREEFPSAEPIPRDIEEHIQRYIKEGGNPSSIDTRKMADQYQMEEQEVKDAIDYIAKSYNPDTQSFTPNLDGPVTPETQRELDSLMNELNELQRLLQK